MSVASVEALTELGFTRLEAEVYVYLLSHPPATGYGVAKGVGKTNANTYKALESLEAKGAILVDAGSSRVCRAVPAEELLGQLARRFEHSQSRARESLRKLTPARGDDRIYHLSSRDQVLERARHMLAAARHVVVGDLFPDLVFDLRPQIAECAERGVPTTFKVYEPTELGAAHTIHRRQGHDIVDRLPYSGLSLNVDGREHLLAGLTEESPLYAIWTASPPLAHGFYNSVIHELILTDLRQHIKDGADNAELLTVLESYAYLHPVSSRGPVYQEYMRGLADQSPSS